MELVAQIGGVRFVNDSKATNVESALRSIESFDSGLVPIIGGRYKGGDSGCSGPLASRAKAVVAIARQNRCSHALAGWSTCASGSLEEAVEQRVRAGAAVGRRAVRAGVRELRHVHRLRRTRRKFKEHVARLARRV